jgi:hypothetical protein
VSKPARKKRTAWAVMSSSSHSVVRTQDNKQFDSVPQTATLSHKAVTTNVSSATKRTPQKQRVHRWKWSSSISCF